MLLNLGDLAGSEHDAGLDSGEPDDDKGLYLGADDKGLSPAIGGGWIRELIAEVAIQAVEGGLSVLC